MHLAKELAKSGARYSCPGCLVAMLFTGMYWMFIAACLALKPALDVQAFDLQEQIQHKIAYVQQHMSAQQSAPLAIIGHSIGEEPVP